MTKLFRNKKFLKSLIAIGAILVITATAIYFYQRSNKREEIDVLVIGGGLAGYAALYSGAKRSSSSSVVLVNASESTTEISSGTMWSPNHGLPSDVAVSGNKADFVEHALKNAFPKDDGAYARPDFAVQGLESFWDNSPKAFKTLASLMDARADDFAPDYIPQQDRSVVGHHVKVYDDTGALINSGKYICDKLLAAAKEESDSVEVFNGYRVTEIKHKDSYTEVHAEKVSDNEEKKTWYVKGRVVMANGGSIRSDSGLKKLGVEANVTNSCASQDSKGNLVPNSPVSKGNMWAYETMYNPDNGDFLGTAWFLWYGWPHGDFIVVDKDGNRVYDETLAYNQRAEFHIERERDDDFDTTGNSKITDHPTRSTLYLVMGTESANAYSVKGKVCETIDQVAEVISGDSTATAANLTDTINKFNQYAVDSSKPDPFGRGNGASGLYWYNAVRAFMGLPALTEENPHPSPLLTPFDSNKSFTVTELRFGGIDTKAGWKVDKMQKTSEKRTYAAGNAVGSPFGQTYLAPGNTLGYALVSGFVAGGGFERFPDASEKPFTLNKELFQKIYDEYGRLWYSATGNVSSETDVWDFTAWAAEHPGGSSKINKYAGDGTFVIKYPHSKNRWDSNKGKFTKIGTLGATMVWSDLSLEAQGLESDLREVLES
jgi:hypothetical protein